MEYKSLALKPPSWYSICTEDSAVVPLDGLYLTRTGKKTVSTDPNAAWHVQVVWTAISRPHYKTRLKIHKIVDGVVATNETPFINGFFLGIEDQYLGSTVGGQDKRACFDQSVTSTAVACTGFNCSTGSDLGTNSVNLPSQYRNSASRNCYTTRAGYFIAPEENDGFNCTGGEFAGHSGAVNLDFPTCPTGYNRQSARATNADSIYIDYDAQKCKGIIRSNSAGVIQQMTCTVSCCPTRD